MPYVFVRENAIKYWCTVQGLNHNEVRILAEKVQDQPEHHDDRAKRVEFSLPTWLILNALEMMGFKVVSSGPYVTGVKKHDQREFVWTLHKTFDEWESSSKWIKKKAFSLYNCLRMRKLQCEWTWSEEQHGTREEARNFSSLSFVTFDETRESF